MYLLKFCDASSSYNDVIVEIQGADPSQIWPIPRKDFFLLHLPSDVAIWRPLVEAVGTCGNYKVTFQRKLFTDSKWLAR